METYFIYETAFQPLTIVCGEDGLRAIRFGRVPQPGAVEARTALSDQVSDQLEEYFAGRLRVFDLPLAPCGTSFQQAVWAALLQIPYGEVRTYADIASAVNCPKGFRAVGAANHKNPIPIIIPCHRVVGSNGSLTGYAWGLACKQQLLDLERFVCGYALLLEHCSHSVLSDEI
ncbi:MAG: methylated-DNA--[protein]-cysteine S-methyltransferase [Oscillospiraceae bacterium]|nr:methylated-DNA--[protein]-cysteine S-methyltransferase [Oscillospiraceae bacterium]